MIVHHLLPFILILFTIRTTSTTTSESLLEQLMGAALFPPLVHPSGAEGPPTGHMKPFGHQRKPQGPIVEYTDALHAGKFWEYHVKPHVPLVYRGYVKSSPAILKWTDEYLGKKYGNLDVLVEHKVEDRTSSSGRLRLGDFLQHYNTSDMYVVSVLPTEMMSEVRAIPSVLCGTFKNYTHESNFWVSSGGTRSVVHYDADHNLHCVLAGRKDFMMINNNITTKTNLYYKKKYPSAGSGFSFLDPDRIDMYKFKRIAEVPWSWATVYPGDCIFIPAQYIHQVRGYGRTVAVTTLFTADMDGNFSDEDCTEDIMTKYHTMDEIPFQWTYKKGDATIDMGYMTVERVRRPYRELVETGRIQKKGGVSKKLFQVLAGRIGTLGRNTTRTSHVWNNVFGFADHHRMTIDDFNKITLDEWKCLIRAIEDPHGVVTNGYEPVFVRPGEPHRFHGSDIDDDVFLTNKEKEERQKALHDPMIDHLKGEERKKYLKEKRMKKMKHLGKDMDGSEVDAKGVEGDEDGEDLDDKSWATELGWTFEEIPFEYRAEMRQGRIPHHFKETFLNSLSDVIREKFKDELEGNIVPEDLMRELGVEK